MLVPERFWEQMTAAEREVVDAYVEGFRYEPRFTCPECGCWLAVKLKIAAGAVKIDADGQRVLAGPQTTQPAGPSTPPKSLGAAERVVIEAARTSGVLSAFIAAVNAEKEHGGVPTDIESFFMLFWKTVQPTKVSSVVLATWIEEFGGRIDVWQAQGIIAVLSDGLLMTFFPNRLTLPARVAANGQGAKISNANGFEMWRKGRFGYVPVEARSFGDALRQRNIGSFGSLVQ